MKHLFIVTISILLCSNIQAQITDKVVGRPELSKHEFGLNFGNTSSAPGGLTFSYNRYLSEKHILHFAITPLAYGGNAGLIGSFEFWNEKRKFIGKTGNMFLSHGLEFNIGDRNKFLTQIPGEPLKSAFASGLGYNIGFGHIINDRLTFTAIAKPRVNYYRLNSNGITHSIKPELNLSFGVNYRFK